MENYRKGKNVEEPFERDKIPINDLATNFLWMQVRGGSKIRNLVSHAMTNFPESKSVVWTGFGVSVGKTITCAEIMKREFNNSLHQITRLCYRSVEEFWDPLLPELDQLVVKRKLPMIHIYLSSNPLNSQELGYQAPGTIIQYKSNNEKQNKHQNQHPKKIRGFQNGKRNFSKFDKRPNQSAGSSKSNANQQNSKDVT